MKKHFVTLIIAASAVIHAQAAELAAQLQGYWKPDMEKTAALAKKADREMDPMTQAMMGRMVFEFQKDKMIVHPPAGMTAADEAPVGYKVTAEDKAAKMLTLSVDGKEGKVRFDKEQMAMFDEESGWMVFNRMSKEDFGKRKPALREILEEGEKLAPASDKPADVPSHATPAGSASGKIAGKEFKVEKATLDNDKLELWQGGGESKFDTKEIVIMNLGNGALDGKKFSVKRDQDGVGPTICMSYKKEGEQYPGAENYFNGFSMKLEFGTAKNGKIPGKIELRLPDKAGSFVSGTFEAEIK